MQAKVNSDFRQSALVAWHGQTSDSWNTRKGSEMSGKKQKANSSVINHSSSQCLSLIVVIQHLWNSAGVCLEEGSWHHCYRSTYRKKLRFIYKAPSAKSWAVETPKLPRLQSFLTRQISKCYFTTALQPRLMHLGPCSSDFAAVGWKEIQVISSLTHSRGHNSGVCDSVSVVWDVKCVVN